MGRTFFDLVLDAIKKAVFVDCETISPLVINSHIADLYAYSSLSWALDAPFRALALQSISNHIRNQLSEAVVKVNQTKKAHTYHIFRMINHFCVMHEIGHIADKNKLVSLELSNKISVIKKTYLDKNFQNFYDNEDRGYLKSIAEYIENSDIQHELRADIYALRGLFISLKEEVERNCNEDEIDSAKAYYSLLIYEAMCILHYVQSDADFMKRLTTKSKELNTIEKEQEMLLARGDVRIYLAAHLSSEIFDDPEVGVELLAKYSGVEVPHYSKNYMKIVKTSFNVIQNNNRKTIFSLEEEYKKHYSSENASEQVLRSFRWVND